MKVAFGYGSDARVSGENQDAYGVFEYGDLVLGVVCDGVGGHTGGQQASNLAVRTVAQSLAESQQSDLASALIEAITMANRAIYEAGRKSHRLMGMSTTIVAAVVHGDRAVIAHVGDSRAYLVRNGETIPLTRDHTMVNMFVDNDLLSPEDAASHPEAHVLARSLGSERQVDIDIHDTLQLADSDVLLLCTDGLHGALDEQEIGGGDWTRPSAAARQLLRRVGARGGNDNATLVGFRIGGHGEPGMMPTALPSLESPGDVLTPSSHDSVHAPDLLNEPMPPALYPIEPEDEPTAYPEDTNQSGDHFVSPPSAGPGTASPLPPRVMSRTPAPPPERPPPKNRKSRKMVMVVLALAIAASLLMLVGAYAWTRFAGQRPGTEVATSAEELPAAGNMDFEPGQPPLDVPGSPAGNPPTEGTIAKLDPLPEPPRLDPTRGSDVDITHPAGKWVRIRFPKVRKNNRTPSRFGNAPPDRGAQVEIQRRVDEGAGCDEAEAIIQRAMRSSTDNAPLYRTLWFCFQDVHQPELESSYDGPYAFLDVRPHLEGTPQQPRAGATLPYWYLDATDGIERRMDLFDEHARSDQLFDDVILDGIEPDIVATRFHHDLVAECAFAQGFASLPNPTREQILDWARRVYVVRKHIDDTSEVGRLLSGHDIQATNRIRRLLADATRSFEDLHRSRYRAFLEAHPGRDHDDFDWQAVADEANLPVEVARALLTASEVLPPPNSVPVKKPDPLKIRPSDPCANPSNPGCIPE